MKTVIAFFVALLLSTASLAREAEDACSKSGETSAVFFGSGILASRLGAQRSLARLTDALGTTVGGQSVSYAVVYNPSDGAFAELLRSLDEQRAPFTSQIGEWVQGRGEIPPWFSDVMSRVLQADYPVNASALQDQLGRYQRAIAHGQKVLVVSHGQGNVYANLAKQLLEANQDVDMRAFGIFAVATPAGNVGGAPGPYETNHRDLISLVPGSLPWNSTLHDAAGVLANSRDRVAANSFVDTYMSSDYDMRDALVSGIKTQLATLSNPQVACENYRKQFIGLLTGTYWAHCSRSTTASPLTIDQEARVSFPDGVIDLSGPEVTVDYVSRRMSGDAEPLDRISLNAGEVYGDWSLDNSFNKLERDSMTCERRDGTDPTTYTSAAPVDIAKKAGQLLEGYRTGFTARQCLLIDKATGESLTVPPWQPVSIRNGRLSIGDTIIDLNAARKHEYVVIPKATYSSPADYEPQFALAVDFVGGGRLDLHYKLHTGFASVGYATEKQSLNCSEG